MEVLGIDIGGTGIKGAPVDVEKGVFLTDRHRIQTPQPATPEDVVQTVKELVNYFKWTGPVGCGFPAAIKDDIVLTAANIHNSWIGKNAGKLIMEATGCVTHVVNDVDAAGLAEMTFGAGKHHNGTVIMVALGTGIGTSFFSDSVLLPNTEFGHIILRNGKEAEKYASNAVRKHKDLSWDEWTKRLNKFFKYMDDLLWPDLYIIGGGVVKNHDMFLNKLESKCAEIVPAELLNHAGVIGSALCFKYAEDHFKLMHPGD